MPTNIPQAVQPVLDAYIAQVQAAIPDLLSAVYLHGSLALGAFQPGLSDLDFISVLSRPSSASDLAQLAAIHQELSQRYPQLPLSGSYLQWQDIGQSEAMIQPHPHFHDRVLHASGSHDINPVTWWLLKQHGITLLGPPATQLDIVVDWDDLLASMHQNMESYWASFTTNPQRIAWLFSDYGIQWTVLGVLRQYYTFREHDITTKTGAGDYGLAQLPKQWRRIIQEAINLRLGTTPSLYRLRIMRAIDAYRFLVMIIKTCRRQTR